MANSDLNFKIILEIPDADITIDGLDMDFVVHKSSKSVINTAYINVWNLDETKYQRLGEQEYLINMYTQYGDNDACLVFRGYSDTSFTRRFSGENRIVDEEDNSVDIPVLIRLLDGKTAYMESFINKSYREEVSSTRILKDCFQAMGIGTAIFSSKIPEKKYQSYKAIGRPHVIVENLCRTLKISMNVQNNLIYLKSDDENPELESTIVLNNSNSLPPQRQSDGLIEISSKFLPGLNPNDFVKCEFDGTEGIFSVSEVISNGNNYGIAGITKITIGI